MHTGGPAVHTGGPSVVAEGFSMCVYSWVSLG